MRHRWEEEPRQAAPSPREPEHGACSGNTAVISSSEAEVASKPSHSGSILEPPKP